MSDIQSSQSVARRIEAIWAESARAGTRLPSEPDLAAASGVSRPMVREALIRLEERGYIHRTQGTGTAANRDLLRVKARLDEQVDHLEVIRNAGFTPSVRVIRQEISPVTPEEQDRFQIAAGASALRTTKVWTADDLPVALAADSIPFATAIAPTTEVDASLSVFELAEALNGTRAVWETAWVNTVLLDERELWLSGREAPEPALCLTLHGMGARGETAYWARELQLNSPIEFAMVRHVSAP